MFLSFLKYLALLIAILAMSLFIFIRFAPVFGGTPDDDSMVKINASEQYADDRFNNSVTTRVDTRDPQTSGSMLEFIWSMLSPPADKNPQSPLPSKAFSANTLNENSFMWLGHSTVLMNLNGVILLTDPVFHEASPIAGMVKPFDFTNPITIEDLPVKIDAIIISHDHYDHLDYKAIKKLSDRTERFFVPLGVKAHLQKWGVASEKIVEHDWYDEQDYKGVQFITTPARHFSGRGISDRFSTLWSSWVFKTPTLSVFFNGDSGYFEGFKAIGEQYGPFDIAFIENGAYDEDWSEIHMFPEQSVQAAIDLKAKAMFPMHWGKFDLSTHHWDEPVIRAYNEAQRKNVTIATPMVGEVFEASNVPNKEWWIGAGKK